MKTIQLSSQSTKHDEFIKSTFSIEILFETNNIFAIRGNLSFKKFLQTVQRTEITDPLKVCLCLTHKLPENFLFGFSVLHNTLGKILEIQLTLISAQQAIVVVEVHYCSLLRFQIFIFHRLSYLFN